MVDHDELAKEESNMNLLDIVVTKLYVCKTLNKI